MFPFLYTLKILENLSFSNVFMGCNGNIGQQWVSKSFSNSSPARESGILTLYHLVPSFQRLVCYSMCNLSVVQALKGLSFIFLLGKYRFKVIKTVE